MQAPEPGAPVGVRAGQEGPVPPRGCQKRNDCRLPYSASGLEHSICDGILPASLAGQAKLTVSI